MRNIILIVILVNLLILPGCKNLQQKKANSEETTIIKGVVNKDGDFTERKAKAGELPKQYLSGLNDEVSFEAGKPFELVISDFDPDFYDVRYTFDDNSKTGSFKVVNKEENDVIILKNKCERINVGPGKLPEIKIDQAAPKEQVIITPRYNKECEFLGYEIRFGSTTRGCKDGKYLKPLSDCRSEKKTVRRNKEYWQQVLFGD